VNAETFDDRKKRARGIVRRLAKEYPHAATELDYGTPFELLIATILSAQCTDAKVNEVTRTLFRDYPGPEAFAAEDLSVLEERLYPTGFFRQKANATSEASREIVGRFGGEVPRTMDELLSLPRVARKTANVVLTQAFGIASGIVVDTHVARLSRRMGLSEETLGDKIEEDLTALLPRSRWIAAGDTLIFHGRRVCHARKPLCEVCAVSALCPKLLDT